MPSRQSARLGGPVLESAITAIDDLGPIYRGVPAVALADNATI